MYKKAHWKLQKEVTTLELAPSPYFLLSAFVLLDMNVYTRFDETPSLTLQDIKETLSMHKYTKATQSYKGE